MSPIKHAMSDLLNLNLQKFDPKSAMQHRVWLIIGTRGSGKSVLQADLLYKTRGSFDFGLAMTGTHSSAETLREMFPPCFVYDNGYQYDKAEKLLALSKECVKKGKERSVLLLLDDCAFDDKVMKSDTMKELHLNGRHAKITLMSTTQYSVTVGPLLRANVDYVFALADNVISNRKRLHTFFFGCFETFQQFDTVFKHVTKDHGALVLDNTNKTGSLEESIRWYKADPTPPKFQVVRNRFYAVDDRIRQRVKQLKAAKQEAGEVSEIKTISV